MLLWGASSVSYPDAGGKPPIIIVFLIFPQVVKSVTYRFTKSIASSVWCIRIICLSVYISWVMSMCPVCVFLPCAHLMFAQVRRGCLIPWNWGCWWVCHHVGAGNLTWILCEDSKAFSLLSRSPVASPTNIALWHCEALPWLGMVARVQGISYLECWARDSSMMAQRCLTPHHPGLLWESFQCGVQSQGS